MSEAALSHFCKWHTGEETVLGLPRGISGADGEWSTPELSYLLGSWTLTQRLSEGLSAPLGLAPQHHSMFPTVSCVQDPEFLTICLGPGPVLLPEPQACPLCLPSSLQWGLPGCLVHLQHCGFPVWLSQCVPGGSQSSQGTSLRHSPTPQS